MTKANKNKSDQLGMNYSTAYHQLRKQVLFMMAQKCGMDTCFRCEQKIEKHEELTIEHKIEWQGRDNEYFWDLDNIAFSHKECNRPRHEKRPPKRLTPEGMSWCLDCDKFLSNEMFKTRPDGGTQSYCIEHEKERKRKCDMKRRKKQKAEKAMKKEKLCTPKAHVTS